MHSSNSIQFKGKGTKQPKYSVQHDAAKKHGKIQPKRVPILQFSLLLQIEAKARIEIWKRVPIGMLLALRLTCRRIKSEIDHNVGLSLTVDESKPSFNFASEVGIQHLRVKKLTTEHNGKITQFLIHPLLLQKLEILGDISPRYASYILESSHHIQFLAIHFAHHILRHHVPMFPVAHPYQGLTVGALPFVKTLHVQSTALGPVEFTRMCDAIRSLFTEDMKLATLKNLEFSIRPAPGIQRVLRTFHELLAEFVNRNAETLVNLHIEINQRLTKLSHSDVREVLESHSSTSQFSIDKISASQSSIRVQIESHTQQLLHEVHPHEHGNLVSWTGFPELKNAFLSVNKFAFFWTGCLIRAPCLVTLYLNLKIAENWDPYVTIISGCAESLEELQLHNVNRGNVGTGVYVRENVIDLSVFSACENLVRLTLFCKEDEVLGTNYELKNIGAVLGASRLSFAWVGLSPCQLTRLLVCSRYLNQLDLEYCSMNDSDFAAYFCRLRWLLALKCTGIESFSIVDHKIRFQGKMSAVNGFLNAQWKHTAYYDGFYIKVFYSSGIVNKSRGTQKRSAFPSVASTKVTDSGGSETPISTGGEGGDEVD